MSLTNVFHRSNDYLLLLKASTALQKDCAREIIKLYEKVFIYKWNFCCWRRHSKLLWLSFSTVAKGTSGRRAKFVGIKRATISHFDVSFKVTAIIWPMETNSPWHNAFMNFWMRPVKQPAWSMRVTMIRGNACCQHLGPRVVAESVPGLLGNIIPVAFDLGSRESVMSVSVC